MGREWQVISAQSNHFGWRSAWLPTTCLLLSDAGSLVTSLAACRSCYLKDVLFCPLDTGDWILGFMFFYTLLLLLNWVRCRHHPIFILKGQSSYGPSPKLWEMEADGAPGWDLELFFFFSPEVFKRVMWPWHPSLGKKKQNVIFFLVLIGMSGPQVSVGINHSIRKALWKIVPEGVDGLVYANHTE